MQKTDGWYGIWISVLVVGVVLLGLTLGIAFFNRENGAFANVASIWGLFVGLIGFIVTIYTLFETQRVSRQAQQEIRKAASEAQQAVANAQEQTRQMLERVRQGVREADFSTLRMWVRELRTAATQGDWRRVLLFAEECPVVIERLRNAVGLLDSERNDLGEGADNLRTLQAHIRNNLLNTETTSLTPKYAKSLEALATLLEQVGGRLYHEATRGANP
jgi:hypothetical protein